jgi:hypothetical protein
MIVRLAKAALVVATVAALVKVLPDIRRYLELRQM